MCQSYKVGTVLFSLLVPVMVQALEKKKQAVGIDLLVENSSEREMLFPVESKKRRKT